MGLQPAYDGDDNDAVLIEGANGFRYPFEAEWEWAAHCGEDHDYAGSDDINAVAWYDRNSGGQTHSVGLRQANACGLKDMTGSVHEWVADDYDNPGQHRPGAALRALRGGSWAHNTERCRVVVRFRFSPEQRHNFLGLRLFRSLD